MLMLMLLLLFLLTPLLFETFSLNQVEHDGVWKDVDRVPGAVLLICGLTVESWTLGRLRAVVSIVTKFQL